MVSRARLDMLEHDGSVLHKGNGRVKLMGTAAQRLKLRARGQTIGRIWKIVWLRAPKSDRRRGQAGRDALLRPWPLSRAPANAATAAGDCETALRFESALVEIGRAQLDRNAGGFEQSSGARRCATPTRAGREQAKGPSFTTPNDGGAR